MERRLDFLEKGMELQKLVINDFQKWIDNEKRNTGK